VGRLGWALLLRRWSRRLRRSLLLRWVGVLCLSSLLSNVALFKGGRQLSAYSKFIQANSEKIKAEVQKRKDAGGTGNMFAIGGEMWKKVGVHYIHSFALHRL
jgi:hypothetical protein